MSRESITLMDRNYCVSAGAGAGKTTCLVDAYLGLLTGNGQRSPLEPDQVVAITFTEKAAAEMRSRVMDLAAEKAAAQGGRWREVLPVLEWAPISTIHSFCATVLRDYGAGLGIDPDFTIMDGDTFGRMLDEAIDSLLRRLLSERDDGLKLLLQHYSLNGDWGIEGMLAAAYHGLATLGISAAHAQEATAQAHDEATQQAESLAGELISICDDLTALIATDDSLSKSKAKFATLLLNFNQHWPTLRDRLEKYTLNNTVALQIEAMLGPNRGGTEEISALRKQAKQLAKDLADGASLPDAAMLSHALLNLLEHLEQDLAKEKARRSALSFDDLLLMSLNLLEQNPNVLKSLRKQFRAVMVDEFQDVNPVQGRFLRLLCGFSPQKQSDDSDKPLLLVVGDRKQSIYAFRGADVRFFAQTMESFETREWGSLIALQRNFRSHPDLIGFFNRAFEAVFAQRNQEEHGVDSYVQFRPDDCQRPGKEQYSKNDAPSVELLDCSNLADENDSADAWRSAEADAVAAHILGLVKKNEANPGDIAILLRRMTQVALYERALQKADVGYYTVRGKGFYQCLEVNDMVMAMRVLLNPYDDLAATAFLRSPLIGLSDESLLAFVHGDDSTESVSIARALRGGAFLPAWCGENQTQRLANAREIVARLGPWAGRMAPAELLAELTTATDYETILLAMQSGGQKAANLRKLIETARSFNGGTVQYLRDLEQKLAEDNNAPQATIMGAQGQAVQLMTIHQAKGLQFPVVVLCDLGAGRGPSDNLPGPGPGGVISLRPINFGTGQKPSNPVYTALTNRSKAVEEAEAARLLYVACTRAEKRLILSLTGAKRQGIWAKWVQKCMAEDPVIMTTPAQRINDGRGASDKAIRVCDPPSKPGPYSEEGQAIVKKCMSPRLALPRLLRTSVSGMEDWLECPRLFIFTQRLGLDTAALSGGSNGSHGGDGVQRAVMLGSLVHNILEIVDMDIGGPAIEAAYVQAADILGTPDDLKIEAIAAASAFFDLPLAARLKGLPPEAILREQPFLLHMEQNGTALELIGEIDLAAIAENNGSWIIVDYKVSRSLDPGKYRNQMLIYSTAWWRMLDREKVPKAILVHLTPGNVTAHEMKFSVEDLQAMEGRLMQAAIDICALGGGADPAQAPRGRNCQRNKCPLAVLCPED